VLHTSANATSLERVIQQRHRHSGIDKYKDIHVNQQRYRLSDIDKYKDIHFGVHDVSTRISYIMYVHRPKIGKTNNMVAIKTKQANNKTKRSKKTKISTTKKTTTKGLTILSKIH
jgi:hypothetical protein